MNAAIIDLLDRTDLRANTYRTAVRLARHAHDETGYVRVTYAEMLEICETDSQATVRRQLAELAQADVITYRRNDVVNVYFHIHAPAGCSPRDQKVPRGEQPETTEDAGCSLRDQKVPRSEQPEDAENPGCSLRAQKVPRSEQNAHHARTKALTTALTTAGWQAGQPSQPEPGEGAGGGPEDTDDDGAPVTDQDRAVALLTDPEVGLADGVARELAAAFGFEEILRQTMRFVRDRAAGVVRSPAVLRRRLRDGYAAAVTDQDRASALYRRHVSAVEDEQREYNDLRRRYIPEEFADVIIG